MTTTFATVILQCGNCSHDAAVTADQWAVAGIAYCTHCHTDGIDVAWHRSHADLPDSYYDDTDED